MTAVGKILVFLNLVFSLVVGAFVVMIYLARTHWVEEYNKLSGRYQIAVASEQTYKSESIKAQQDADARIAQVKALLKTAEGDLIAERTINDQLRKDVIDLKKKSTTENSVSTQALAEVQLRQEDVAKMRDTLKKETDENIRLVKENNKLRDEATAAKIEQQATLAVNQRLEGQLQQMARDMARVRANVGGAAGGRLGNKNPPPESVEGLVKSTDPSGLMTLTIGSDAGLTKGHTLEVFRLSPIPSQSRYLGTVRILEATATQAVAQPIGKMSAPPQVGDRVASRILGG